MKAENIYSSLLCSESKLPLRRMRIILMRYFLQTKTTELTFLTYKTVEGEYFSLAAPNGWLYITVLNTCFATFLHFFRRFYMCASTCFMTGSKKQSSSSWRYYGEKYR